MSAQDNEKLVYALYAASGEGDWASVRGMLTDDFILTEPPSLPFGGTWRGPDSLEAMYSCVINASGNTRIDFLGMSAGEEYVVAQVILHLLDHGVSARIAEAFRIRDGKVSEIIPYYFDPAAVQPVYADVPRRLLENYGLRPE